MDISVIIISYNQAKTIDRTLESVFRQKTDYLYEVLVSDDASTDASEKLLKEWKKRYPDKIRIHINKHNVGPTKNAYPLLALAKGRYIASLECDDYWSDELFLQRNVTFLENHHEYIGVQDKCIVVDKNDNPIPEKNTTSGNEFWKYTQSEYSLAGFAEWKMPGHLSAMVYRNIYPTVENRCSVYWQMDRYVGDRTIVMLLAARGKIRCTEHISLHYRLCEDEDSTSWMALNKRRNMRVYEYKLICRLEDYVRHNYDHGFSMEKLMRSKIAAAVSVCLFCKSIENVRVVLGIVFTKGKVFENILLAIKAMIIKLYWIAKKQPYHRLSI